MTLNPQFDSEMIYQCYFLGLPEDLHIIVDELIDLQLYFILGQLATPIRVDKCSKDNIEIEFWRFYSSARHGRIAGWRDGDKTRLTIFGGSLDWRNVPEDGWNILYNRLVQLDKIQQSSHQSAAQADAAKPEKPNALQTKWDKMSDKTKERFRQAWKIWNRMRKEYRQESIDGKTKEAQPTIKDWQTKVKKDLHWDVSESRLRDVKEMGEFKIIK